MRKIFVLGMITVLLVAPGCSSATTSESASGEPSSSSSSSPPDHTQVLKTYFDAYGMSKPIEIQPMLTVAAPNSPAYVFAQHQVDVGTAYENDLVESGGTARTTELTKATVTGHR